jgi:hypothetical protein
MEKQDMQRIIEMLGKAQVDRKADKDFLARLEADRKTDKEDFLAKLDVNQEKADAMLAKLDAYQEKAAADKEEMKADIKAWQEKIAAETEPIKARTRAIRENMGTSHKEMVAVIEPGRDMKTIACQEMEARPEKEKPASVDTKPEAAQQDEVPNEDAEVMPVGESKKKRPRARKLPAERRRLTLKNSTRENCGPHKKLVVDRRGTIRRAKVARKTPIDHKMSGRATVARQNDKIRGKKMSRRATVA